MRRFNFLRKLTADHRLILVFCVLAAIRVFIYSAAFPFFSNVDEWAHFDQVIKYSHGHIPRTLEPPLHESASYIVTYGSPEYVLRPDSVAKKGVPVPLYKQPKEKVQPGIDRDAAIWCIFNNPESTQPPLYYIIAGTWTRVGFLLGLKGGWLLYWIRFLNVIIAAALVWLAYLAASKLFPGNRFVMLSVPLLAAFLPQDTFYAIQSDVLSPLCFGLAFVSMIGFIRDEIPKVRQGILSGLFIAAGVLVKISNIALIVVAIAALLFKIYGLIRKRKFVSALPSIVSFALTLLVPVLIWFAWNLYNTGDFTGSESKIQMMGWTHTSIIDCFSHPIFSFKGVLFFWSNLMITFWRGETIWLLSQAGMPAADIFYWLSSFVLIVLAAIDMRKNNDLQRKANRFAFGSFIALILYMALLSVSFDFGKCYYPSQIFPYFVSGRLISAALIPFLLLYMQGLNLALSPIRKEIIKFGVLIAIVMFISITEVIVNWPVFFSQYNFFHL